MSLPREAYCSECGEWRKVRWVSPSAALCGKCRVKPAGAPKTPKVDR